jgi:hypothetical protein
LFAEANFTASKVQKKRHLILLVSKFYIGEKNGGLKIFKCDESLANPRKKILSNKSLKNLLPVSSSWGDKWDAI